MGRIIFSIFSILSMLILTECSKSSILEKLSVSQSKYFKKEKIGNVPNSMLRSIGDARKSLFEIDLNEYGNYGDTLYLIEGFSIESGMTYSVIWSSKIKPINYKTHFGKNLEIVEYDLFDKNIRKIVSKLEFEKLQRETSVLSGNLYIVSIIIQKKGKLESIKHKVFEDQSFR